jgi:DNA-binding transcriptional regulator YiaG
MEQAWDVIDRSMDLAFPEVAVNPDLRRIVGMRVHRVRRDLGYSQRQFGWRLGVNYVMVSRWEAGRYLPDAVEMFKISKMSGKPLEFFYQP